MKNAIKACFLSVVLGMATAVPGEEIPSRLYFNDGVHDECSTCWLYPASASTYMLLLDGHKGLLQYKKGNPDRLWIRGGSIKGTLSDGEASIQLYRGRSKPSARFRFKDGRLTSFALKGGWKSAEAAEVDRQALARNVDLSEVDAVVRKRPELKGAGRNYWKGSRRLTLWFASPNDAGALLALLALLFLAGALRARGVWSVISLLASAATFVAVWQTASRGSVLAFAAGAFVMLVARFARRLGWRWLLAGGAAFLTLALALVLTIGAMRYSKRVKLIDRSGQTRLETWSAVPRMMACAPNGWWVPAGHCYCDWFQPIHRSKLTYHLLSAHLSILPVVGYAVAFLYIFLWASLLWGVLADAWRNGRVLAAGQWTALAVAMLFSPVGLSHWETWVLPVLALAPWAWGALRRRRFGWGALAFGSVFSLVAIAILAVVGQVSERRRPVPFQVERLAGGVRVGNGEIKAWIVDDGNVLPGGFFGILGKELRKYASDSESGGSVVLADSLDDVPEHVGKLVVTGACCEDYLDRRSSGRHCPQADRLVMLAPPFSPEDLPEDLQGGGLQILIGQLSAEMTGGYDNPPSWVTVVPGAALYVPDWGNRIELFK